MFIKKSLQVFTLLAAALLATACDSGMMSTGSAPMTSDSQTLSSSTSEKGGNGTQASSQVSVDDQTTRVEEPSSSSSQGSGTPSSAIVPEKPKKDNGQESKRVASQLNAEAIAQGDLATLAGTWVNGKGERLVFDQNGLVAWGTGDTVPQLTVPFSLNPDDGVLTGALYDREKNFGVAVMVFPAGKMVKTVDQHGKEIETPVALDDRDHIQVGQAISLDLADRYYKQ